MGASWLKGEGMESRMGRNESSRGGNQPVRAGMDDSQLGTESVNLARSAGADCQRCVGRRLNFRLTEWLPSLVIGDRANRRYGQRRQRHHE